MSQSTKRPSAQTPWHHWYWTARWKRKAKAQLATEPLCRMCLAHDTLTPATIADHIKEHKGDPTLFWEGDLQSLCASHHSGAKRRQEIRGYVQGTTGDGRPVDPGHPWNRPS